MNNILELLSILGEEYSKVDRPRRGGMEEDIHKRAKTEAHRELLAELGRSEVKPQIAHGDTLMGMCDKFEKALQKAKANKVDPRILHSLVYKYKDIIGNSYRSDEWKIIKIRGLITDLMIL